MQQAVIATNDEGQGMSNLYETRGQMAVLAAQQHSR
jgi:hypothetical protein